MSTMSTISNTTKLETNTTNTTNTTKLKTNKIINYKLCVDLFQETRELELVTKTLILNSSYEGTMNEIIQHIFKKEGINKIHELCSARLCYIDNFEQYDVYNTNNHANINTTNTTNSIIIDYNEIDYTENDNDLNEIINSVNFNNNQNTESGEDLNNEINSKFIISNNEPQYSLLNTNIKNQIKNCEIICVFDFNDFYDDSYTSFYKKRFANLEEFEQQYNSFMTETINTINLHRHISYLITRHHLNPHIVAVGSCLGWIKLN
jgi:hypothetical protein